MPYFLLLYASAATFLSVPPYALLSMNSQTLSFCILTSPDTIHHTRLAEIRVHINTLHFQTLLHNFLTENKKTSPDTITFSKDNRIERSFLLHHYEFTFFFLTITIPATTKIMPKMINAYTAPSVESVFSTSSVASGTSPVSTTAPVSAAITIT